MTFCCHLWRNALGSEASSAPEPIPRRIPPLGDHVPLLNVALVPAPDQVVVRLTGDADLSTVPLLDDALAQAAGLGTRGLVDSLELDGPIVERAAPEPAAPQPRPVRRPPATRPDPIRRPTRDPVTLHRWS
jgi:hypothetical protein